MSLPRRHFLICTNRRTQGGSMPSCGENGSSEVAALLRRARDAKGLATSVYVTDTGCLSPCPAAGCTVVVYPEAVWYTGVTAGDVTQIVDEHMVAGRPVERLRDPRWNA